MNLEHARFIMLPISSGTYRQPSSNTQTIDRPRPLRLDCSPADFQAYETPPLPRRKLIVQKAQVLSLMEGGLPTSKKDRPAPPLERREAVWLWVGSLRSNKKARQTKGEPSLPPSWLFDKPAHSLFIELDSGTAVPEPLL
ncbi:hypothetical protein ES708_22611 [subsurface metagenome]